MTPLYIAKGIIFDNKTFIFIKYNNELYIWNNGFLKITHNNITKYELLFYTQRRFIWTSTHVGGFKQHYKS
jgi:hypothetical protein